MLQVEQWQQILEINLAGRGRRFAHQLSSTPNMHRGRISLLLCVRKVCKLISGLTLTTPNQTGNGITFGVALHGFADRFHGPDKIATEHCAVTKGGIIQRLHCYVFIS